ncbi:MAG: hypothetical protein ACYCZF_17045 [Anaerolineae bacterium]
MAQRGHRTSKDAAILAKAVAVIPAQVVPSGCGAPMEVARRGRRTSKDAAILAKAIAVIPAEVASVIPSQVVGVTPAQAGI